MARILVTPRSLTQDPPRELSILTEAGHELVFSTPGKLPGEEELIELLPGCTGWLAGIEPVSPRVIAAADTLKAVSRNGTGVDNLPLSRDPTQTLARDMGVLGLPVSVILDPEGREIARMVGDAEWNSESGKAIIKALISPNS